MLRGSRFESSLASPLAGVSPMQWEGFLKALEVQPIQAISESGGFGSYDLRPRRLVELGYATGLRPKRNRKGRLIYECDLVPWTVQEFLWDPMAQHAVLAHSIAQYEQELQSGTLQRPEGLSVAGSLAILHRGGRGALGGWPHLFKQTRALCEAAQNTF